MTAPGPHPEGAHGYGYGLEVDVYDGARRIWHGGVSLGFTSTDAIYPSLAQEVIVLTNRAWDGSAGWRARGGANSPCTASMHAGCTAVL